MECYVDFASQISFGLDGQARVGYFQRILSKTLPLRPPLQIMAPEFEKETASFLRRPGAKGD